MKNEKPQFKIKNYTNFQKTIYKIVKQIPEGKTLSYKEAAKLAGKPRAWRAVGNILNKNPEGPRPFSEKGGAYGAGKDPQIPCHRVIKSNGRIGGYKDGPRKKASLLRKEGVVIKNWRVVL